MALTNLPSTPHKVQIGQPEWANHDSFLGQEPRMDTREWRSRLPMPRPPWDHEGNINHEEHNQSEGEQSARCLVNGTIGLVSDARGSLLNRTQENVVHNVIAKGRYTACGAILGVLDSGSFTKSRKPSQFHAYILRIGAWQWIPTNDGDLVAKFYYARNKVIWEILKDGLKSKIEIDCSDISALKVTYPEGGPGTLEIMLSERPRFAREIRLNPRRSTEWFASIDFTDGWASLHRKHVLLCAPEILSKHIHKLLSNNRYLRLLSQKNNIDLENPWFEQYHSREEAPESSNAQDLYRRYHCGQLGQQQCQESVPMPMLTNSAVWNSIVSQDGMSIHTPTSVAPGYSSVVTAYAPSSGLYQQQQQQHSMSNWSHFSPLPTLPYQTQLNVSSDGSIMIMNNGAANFMVNPRKKRQRPRRNLLTGTGASPDSQVRAEDVRRLVDDIRQIGVAKALPTGNGDATAAAAMLERISHDLFSDDIDVDEPPGEAGEAMVMATVDSLSSLLQQESQDRVSDTAPPPLNVSAEAAAIQAPDARGGDGSGSGDGGGGDNLADLSELLSMAPDVPGSSRGGGGGDNLPRATTMAATLMEAMSWEQEQTVDVEVETDRVYLSELLGMVPDVAGGSGNSGAGGGGDTNLLLPTVAALMEAMPWEQEQIMVDVETDQGYLSELLGVPLDVAGSSGSGGDTNLLVPSTEAVPWEQQDELAVDATEMDMAYLQSDLLRFCP